MHLAYSQCALGSLFAKLHGEVGPQTGHAHPGHVHVPFPLACLATCPAWEVGAASTP